MRRFFAHTIVCTLACVWGCETQPLAEDAADAANDGFVSGKADGGLSPAELAGVLRVANEEELDTLDRHPDEGGVGLDRRAADGIIEFRAGDDRQLGTADDASFETLVELDGISYVGPIALERLLDYAYAQGFISPGDPDALVGGWTLDEFSTDQLRFQNYPSPHHNNSASGEFEAYGRVLLDVSLDADGLPVASGRCQVLRRSGQTESLDWDHAFSGVPLVETSPGSWRAQVQQSYGARVCDRHDGAKTCAFGVTEQDLGTARIEYDLDANMDGMCARQSRHLNTWGYGHKD